MKIAKYKVDLKCLPTFKPTIRYSDDDNLEATRNKTIYAVTLSYGGFASTANIYYTPQDKTNGIIAPMFNLYNYEFFFVMVNEAIK